LNDRPGHSWSERAAAVGRAVETGLIVVLLGGLVVLATAQIILRNFFSIGLTWSDGLIRLIVLWLALLGALAASRDGRHITMGALTRWLPRRMQIVAGVSADVFAAIVAAVLARYAAAFVWDSREFGDTLLSGVPAWWLQAPMPIVFGLIAWQFLVRAVRRVRHGLPRAKGA
jgi:TRAP-type C4-dicarboxylate transport system permease small subunit